MIINITGQIGSGKTTLAKKLGRALKFPVFEIDDYRRKTEDEACAWRQMYDDAGKHDDYILDTSGLNARLANLLKGNVITIKLVCNKKTAITRLHEKGELDGIKFPYKEFKNHEDFIDFWIKNRRRIKEDFKLDTDKLTQDEVFEKVSRFLKSKIEPM